MRGRGSSPQTRNHYRSVLRGMYKTALLPAYRTVSGVTLNPFRDVPRETVVERTVTISLEDLRSWLKNASYHVRLAVAIAALAPKLRLANVLALTWQEHIDPDLRYITVHRHKTAATLNGRRSCRSAISSGVILTDARQRTHTYVVEYRRPAGQDDSRRPAERGRTCGAPVRALRRRRHLPHAAPHGGVAAGRAGRAGGHSQGGDGPPEHRDDAAVHAPATGP